MKSSVFQLFCRSFNVLFILSCLLFVSCGGSRFDSDKADTDNNKARFKEHLGVELTPDIKEIYCYGDFSGIDYTILFSFSCEPEVIQAIVERYDLELSTKERDSGLYFSFTLPWWDKAEIENLKPYINIGDKSIRRYLWYNEINKKAYYQEFSM